MQDGKPAHARFGSLLIAASAIAFSTTGYFTRLIDLDVPTLLLWRGIFGGLFTLGCLAPMYGRKMIAAFRTMGCRASSLRSRRRWPPFAMSAR